MKLPAVVIVVAATVALGVLAARPTAARPAADASAQLAGPPRMQTHFGHIRSLTRSGGRFVLRFDPAFWLGGTTANRAAVEDGLVRPGESVPNDYYIRDERRRALTFLVPAGARVTVLTRGPRATRIGVAELARIVEGENPRGRALFDPQNDLGYWIRVSVDTVRSLDQQYQP